MSEPLYTAEQIRIPPALPDILKDFTKAAIKTQPSDLLEWSAAYFEALAEGTVPPVKDRYEAGVPTEDGLTPGRLAVLDKQFQGEKHVSLATIAEKWEQAGLRRGKLDELLALGGFSEEVLWVNLLALACTALEDSLPQALQAFCRIVSSEEPGSAVRIPLELFSSVYQFLAKVDGEITQEQVDKLLKWLISESERFAGRVGPQEFLHPNCPRITAHS